MPIDGVPRVIQPSDFFARPLQLAVVLALLASPVAALAQEAPDGHPPLTATRSDEAKSTDNKSADNGKAEAKADAAPLPPTAVT